MIRPARFAGNEKDKRNRCLSSPFFGSIDVGVEPSKKLPGLYGIRAAGNKFCFLPIRDAMTLI
jgi:hypothetical protein